MIVLEFLVGLVVLAFFLAGCWVIGWVFVGHRDHLMNFLDGVGMVFLTALTLGVAYLIGSGLLYALPLTGRP